MTSGVSIIADGEHVIITGAPAGTQNNTYQPSSLGADESSFLGLGSRTTVAFTLPSFSFSGCRVDSFYEDWYNRFHLIPSSIDLLNVITDQSRTITLYNAYFSNKTLVSTSFPAAQGVSITSPVTTPYSIKPLQVLTYTLSVSADGPPTINLVLDWNIPGEDLSIPVTGRRIVVWPFAPNWSTPVVESLDWLTDVLTSHYGNEQRIQLRSKPRRMFEYTTTISKNNSAIASNLLWGWQNRNFAFPLWMDKSTLTSIASAGASTISLSTVNKGFFNGGLLLILNNALDYEAVEITSFTSSSILLAKALERSWPVDSKVYPINISRLPRSVGSRKLTDGNTEMSLSFSADPLQTDPYIPSGAATTTFNGYEVVLRKPNWAQPIDTNSEFDYSEADFLTGGVLIEPSRQFAQIVRRFQWVLKTKTDIITFRTLLGRLKGRFKSAYLPTWLDDFNLFSVEVSSSLNIRVKNNEFYKMVGTDPALKTLMIIPKTGSPIIRSIDTVSLDVGGFTTLGLNAAIGIDLNSTTVSRICLVHLCRLTTDRVTINYLSDSVATVEANFSLVKA